jgi:Nucleotidyl transferase
MIQPTLLATQPGDELETTETTIRMPDQQNCWAIVLAGGEGLRLRPLVRQVLGDDRPKQYVRLLGARTLLRQTLDRIGLAIPESRTLVVTVRHHAGYVAEEFAAAPRPAILVQPVDRGTAAGVLYPAHWIAWRNPEAIVAIFPSDHFLLGEASFMAHVAEVAAWVEKNPDRLVLLGAQPTSPEVEYGWIEPGEGLGELSSGPVRGPAVLGEARGRAGARMHDRRAPLEHLDHRRQGRDAGPDGLPGAARAERPPGPDRALRGNAGGARRGSPGLRADAQSELLARSPRGVPGGAERLTAPPHRLVGPGKPSPRDGGPHPDADPSGVGPLTGSDSVSSTAGQGDAAAGRQAEAAARGTGRSGGGGVNVI